MGKQKNINASISSGESNTDDGFGFESEDPSEEPSEEQEEKLTDDPSGESVPQPSLDEENDDDRVANSESCEETEEEPTEELSEESGPRPVSNCENDDTAQSSEPSEEPDEEPIDEPPCESLCQQSLDSIADDSGCQSESVRVNSNEKKRPLDTTGGESNPLQVYRFQKKLKQEQSLKPKSDVGSEQQEHTGSSGKRRRSRWDLQPDIDEKAGEGDKISKRRKTRWADDDMQLRMLGPINLPDFKEYVFGSDDIEVQELKVKLLEINKKLQGSEVHDDRPEEGRSPSPQPVYNNLGIRINSRDVRFRQKLIQDRQHIVSRLIQKNPTFKPPADYKPPKLCKKIYIPVREYPGYNFVGLIIGPRGNTQKRMEKETGAKILLRGNGSTKDPKPKQKPDPSDNDDLHVLIEADNQMSLDVAVAMVEKLLIPVNEGMNELKRTQLKELAKLNVTCRGRNLCKVSGDNGHRHLKSTFKINVSCDTCGRSGHFTANCPLTALTPGSDLDYYQHQSFLGELGDGKGLSFAASSASSSLPGGCSNAALGTSLGYGSCAGLSSTPSTQSKSNNANLYVGYLPQRVDDNWLRELFSPFGKLIEAKVINDRNTGASKGYGFVRYDDLVSAATAVEHMHGHKIDGKMLVVRVAGPPTSGFSVVNLHPLHSGPSVVSQDILSPTAWPGPPGSMLQEPQASFSKFEVIGMPSSIFVEPGHPVPKAKSGSLDLSPSYIYLGSSDSSSSSKYLSSSYNIPGQIPISSPNSFAEFPGNPSYVGSHQSYFTTPASNPIPGQLHIPVPQGRTMRPMPFTSSFSPVRDTNVVKSGYEKFIQDTTW